MIAAFALGRLVSFVWRSMELLTWGSPGTVFLRVDDSD